jgi:hypothetical protein
MERFLQSQQFQKQHSTASSRQSSHPRTALPAGGSVTAAAGFGQGATLIFSSSLAQLPKKNLKTTESL